MAINLWHDVNNSSLNNEFEKELNTELIIKEEILELNENVTLEHELRNNEITDENTKMEHVEIKEEIIDETILIEPEPIRVNEQFSNVNYKNIGNVSDHYQAHFIEIPFPHRIWDQIISNPSYLNKQERIRPIKPYLCGVCGKSFSKRYVCDKHKRKHRIKQQKILFCNLCNKTFSRTCNLTTHKRAHKYGKEKPFSCNVCNKGYTFKACLDRHKRIHISDKLEKSKKESIKKQIKTTEIMSTENEREACLDRHIRDKLEKSKKKSIKKQIKTTENERVENEVVKSVPTKIKTYLFNKRKSFPCDICYKIFKHQISLFQHKRMHIN